MSAKVQLIGTSHIEAIRHAALGLSLEVVNIDQVPGLRAGESIVFTGPLEEIPDFVFLAIGGVLHTILGLVEDEVPFAVGDAELGQVPYGDRRLIPEQMMRDFFRTRQATRYALLDQFVKRYAAAAPVVCLAPPPPRGRIDRLDKPGRFASILERGFAPPELRRKLYGIEIDILREFCRTSGIDLIEAPDAATDAEGYLREDCHAGDPTHGNARYGALVLDQMQKHLSQVRIVLSDSDAGKPQRDT